MSANRRLGIHDNGQTMRRKIRPLRNEAEDQPDRVGTRDAERAPTVKTAFSARFLRAERRRKKLTSSPLKTLNLGATAMQAREEDLRAREAIVREREIQLSRRESAVAEHASEIRNAQIGKSAQENFNSKLLQANEHLVVASVQLQITAEELEKAKAEMTHLAMHDVLTDLPNRVQLQDRIAQAIAFAKRHDAKLAVLFLDLDRFKEVNDSLGHAIGDRLLQSVAQRLKSAIRDSDTVSRLGGDEFVLLLSEVGQAEHLEQKIEKIHQIITAPYLVEGNDLRISATIGVSIFPEHGEDAETLIRHSDIAMYCAKRNGRGHYQFFTGVED